jgi:signal transduction histidine kinase
MSLVFPIGFLLLCVTAVGVIAAVQWVAARRRRYQIEYAWLEALLEDAQRTLKQKQETERQLLQVQKLEAIGQLAAGIAHEINTPAQYVGDNVRFLYDSFAHVLRTLEAHEALRTQVKMLSSTLSDPPEILGELAKLAEQAEAAGYEHDIEYLRDEIPKAIQGTLEGIGRISTIVRAVKGFSHPGGQHMAPVDLNRDIEDTVVVSRNEWKYVATVVTDFDPDLPLVTCIAGEINQVFLNLIVNAAHAIADARFPGDDLGTITISTRCAEAQVKIVVRDTGAGIPDEIRDRIFDPFFTTKDVGRGTGQGLAIAHAVVVDKHGGTITFETELGRGTTFTILLPLHPATPLEAAA